MTCVKSCPERDRESERGIERERDRATERERERVRKIYFDMYDIYMNIYTCIYVKINILPYRRGSVAGALCAILAHRYLTSSPSEIQGPRFCCMAKVPNYFTAGAIVPKYGSAGNIERMPFGLPGNTLQYGS